MPATPAAPSVVRHLTDSEIADVLAAMPRAVVVEVSTDWCVPCRLQRPIIRKLAAEFAGKGTILAVDGDEAEHFTRAHGVDSFPQLLLFWKGAYVDRIIGFRDVEETRVKIGAFFGVDISAAPSAADQAFAAAHAQAYEAMGEILRSTDALFEPVHKAIEPFVALLEEDFAAGRITRKELWQRYRAEWRRLSAPFEAERAADRDAQKKAYDTYEALMAVAVDAFIAAAAASKQGPAACRPGDPFCRMG